MPHASNGQKICTKCREQKPVSDFAKDKGRKDGYYSWCNDCSRAKSNAWRLAHPEQHAATLAKWRKNNPDRIAQYARNHYSKNPELYAGYSRAYRERNPEKVKLRARIAHLRDKHGMTVDEYEAMWDAQKGVCAICGGGEVKRLLAVDHCHETGRIRGLLCSDCNVGLGQFRDDPKRLARAIRYLKKS